VGVQGGVVVVDNGLVDCRAWLVDV
jgi:hypothetical protein